MARKKRKKAPVPERSMSPYERNALREIQRWKKPKKSIFDAPLAFLSSATGSVADAAKSVPGVETAASKVKEGAEWAADKVKPATDMVIEKVVGGLVTTLNDWALASVRPESIRAEFAKTGASVSKPADIHELDLEQVDNTIGWLAAKYKGLAAVEGGATGTAGMLGIPPNIVLLVGLCQRAIGEYATYTGFDVNNQRERLYAMNVLGLASSPRDSAKLIAMSQLVRISQEVARKTAWRELEQYVFVQIIKRIATALGIRLTKAKLAQMVPVMGGFVGAGFDAYFVAKVCDAAFMLYRERFLASKFGAEIIEATVDPAEGYEPDYEDK